MKITSRELNQIGNAYIKADKPNTGKLFQDLAATVAEKYKGIVDAKIIEFLIKGCGLPMTEEELIRLVDLCRLNDLGATAKKRVYSKH